MKKTKKISIYKMTRILNLVRKFNATAKKPVEILEDREWNGYGMKLVDRSVSKKDYMRLINSKKLQKDKNHYLLALALEDKQKYYDVRNKETEIKDARARKSLKKYFEDTYKNCPYSFDEVMGASELKRDTKT